jgi:hypothetical protein
VYERNGLRSVFGGIGCKDSWKVEKTMI